MNNWEACPVCKGTGNRADNYIGNALQVCTVCNGMKIISSLTGQPPRPIKELYQQCKTPQQIKDYQDELEEAIMKELGMSSGLMDSGFYPYNNIVDAIRKALAEKGGEAK